MKTTSAQPGITLAGGIVLPQLGFGVWKMADADARSAAGIAFDAGYRLVDTAAIYGNEIGVGQAIRDAPIARADLCITTKLWNEDHGYEKTIAAFEASLARLGLDYLDLYLIHWPVPENGDYVDAWRAMISLKDAGKVRVIGVSNFHPAQLERLIGETGVAPALNQVELHPRFQQIALREFHVRHGIATQAWSPLGRGTLLADPTIAALARKYGKSPAQIILRWHLDSGIIAIPKSATPARIAQNLDVFDFCLDGEDILRIGALDCADGRIGIVASAFA